MRLIKINISSLFCKFDYEIPLKTKDNITILYGLNGHGKTTILRMINAFFQKQFNQFMKLPFQSISFIFDNDQVVTIYKNLLFLQKKSLTDIKYDVIIGASHLFKQNNLIFESVFIRDGGIYENWDFFLFNGIYFENLGLKDHIIENLNVSAEKKRIKEELNNKEKVTKICQDSIEIVGFGEKFDFLANSLESQMTLLRKNLESVENEIEKSQKINELNTYVIKWDKIRHFKNEVFHPRYRKMGQEINLDFLDILDLAPDSPRFLKEINNSIKSELIDSQRLLQLDQIDEEDPSPYRLQERRMKERKRWTVSQCSDEIKSAICIKNDEYASISQKLDKTFPYRLLESIKARRFEKDKLGSIESKLDELYDWQESLIKLGIFSEDIKSYKKITTADIDRKDKTLDAFFQLYINDTTEKIAVFNELSQRLQNFVNIVDSLFGDKTLKFSKSDGMVFTDKITDVIVKPDQLSSGEQHIVVLFFDLLFKFNSNALILIDEPEISLHVSWQVKFVKYLQLISKLNGMSFILSTHSPNIVYDRDDLLVEIS